LAGRLTVPPVARRLKRPDLRRKCRDHGKKLGKQPGAKAPSKTRLAET
jgi:hypothetical protein